MTSVSVGSVFLGTAGWVQKVTKREAYRILETFYESGFRWVDTATNYPIDQIPENYGKTIEWLSEFCLQLPELKIFVKAGSATNLGESKQLINASYFALMFDILLGKFRGCFGGLAVHWDDGADAVDRMTTIDFLASISNRGFEIGLSGIANPEIYLEHSLIQSLPWIYQANLSPIRSNQISHELDRIKENFPKAKVYGYNLLGGIAGKGLLGDGDRLSGLRKTIIGHSTGIGSSILDQAISQALSHKVDGLIIGPTSVGQCLEWCATLDRFSLV